MSIECAYCGNKAHDADCPNHMSKRATDVVRILPDLSEDELVGQCRHCGTINKIHPPNCPIFKHSPTPSWGERPVYRNYSGADPRTEGTPGSGEAVNHPNHYTFGKFEVVDVIYDWQPPYPLDNVIKYVARAGKKGGPEKELEDLKKAQFYLNYYIAQKEKD